MAEADEMIRRHGFVLPPFAYWSPEELRERAADTRIATLRMGWGITDYGAGDFDRVGLFLFTLRTGELADLRRGGMWCSASISAGSRRSRTTNRRATCPSRLRHMACRSRHG